MSKVREREREGGRERARKRHCPPLSGPAEAALSCQQSVREGESERARARESEKVCVRDRDICGAGPREGAVSCELCV